LKATKSRLGELEKIEARGTKDNRIWHSLRAAKINGQVLQRNKTESSTRERGVSCGGNLTTTATREREARNKPNRALQNDANDQN
jgi:hypothetical protein